MGGCFWEGVLKMEHCIQQVLHFFTWPSLAFEKKIVSHVFSWETTLLLVTIMGTIGNIARSTIMGTICNIAMGMITGAICSKVLLIIKGNGNRIPMY